MTNIWQSSNVVMVIVAQIFSVASHAISRKLVGFDRRTWPAPLNITTPHAIDGAMSNMPQHLHDVTEHIYMSVRAHSKIVCGDVEE